MLCADDILQVVGVNQQVAMSDFFFTVQGIPLWSAMIGAGAAIFGQIVAGFISVIKDSHLENKREGKLAKVAAVEALVVLENLVNSCHNIVLVDKIYIAPDDETDVTFECELPKVDFLDFKGIDRLDVRFISRILWIKHDITDATRQLLSSDLIPPSYGNAMELRKSHFARVGMKSCLLIDDLCGFYSLPTPVRADYYQPSADFSDALENVMVG